MTDMALLSSSVDDDDAWDVMSTQRNGQNEAMSWQAQTIRERVEDKAMSLSLRMLKCGYTSNILSSYEFLLTTMVCMPVVLCIIGLCGNIVTFCALRTDPERNNASTFLLKALTVVDSIFVLSNALYNGAYFLHYHTTLRLKWSYVLAITLPISSYLFFCFPITVRLYGDAGQY